MEMNTHSFGSLEDSLGVLAVDGLRGIKEDRQRP